jgi:hypothetical protein
MIISHSKKFIMFLPWKTASQTMAERLSGFNESTYNRFFNFNPYLNRVIHQHLTCADFLGLPEAQHGYFLASFVRNPYDRVYSGFIQLKRDIAHQPNLKFHKPWVRDLVMSQLNENHEMLKKANHDFDDWVDLLEEHQVYEQGRNTNLPLHPAHYWTHIAGSQFVDFIGKVETFESDIGTFGDLVGIVDLPKTNSNVTELDAQSTDGPKGYRYADRMRPSSIRKINALFERDFELFDYQKIAV